MTCFMTCYFDVTRLINCITLMTNNVNIILDDINLIKGFRTIYAILLVVFDSMWMTLYGMIDPEESYKTNLVP